MYNTLWFVIVSVYTFNMLENYVLCETWNLRFFLKLLFYKVRHHQFFSFLYFSWKQIYQNYSSKVVPHESDFNFLLWDYSDVHQYVSKYVFNSSLVSISLFWYLFPEIFLLLGMAIAEVFLHILWFYLYLIFSNF